jgi:aminopeptidase N
LIRTETTLDKDFRTNHRILTFEYIETVCFETMNYCYTLFLFFAISLSATGQRKQNPCSAVKSGKTIDKSATLTPAQIARTEKYDVTYYHLDIKATNLNKTISGSVLMKAKARVLLDTVLFELHPNLIITKIMFNGDSVAIKRSGTAVKVAVNQAAGNFFTIQTFYNGTPPDASANPFGDAGLSNATSQTWGNQITWSLSQPFSAYEWWPCKQSLRDKIDSVDVWVTVPSICKAGSNGLLKKVSDVGNGQLRYEWKHRHPIAAYLVSIAIGEYVEVIDFAHPASSNDSILIQHFIYDNPATLTNFQNDIYETARFIELFDSLYGPYPFRNEKYGHSMAPISGGMEHQTMTTQGFFSNTLTAHELAHQWFGDHVTCGSWADIWVNEGFAAYSEYLMLAALYTGQEAQLMTDNHNSVMGATNGAVWVKDSVNSTRIFSNRLTYDKGASIIHTFRYLLDDDTKFFQALRLYQNRFADSVAIGLDVKNVLEEVSGKDLTAAFEQWYFGEGFPTYGVKWNSVNGTLHLKITETVSNTSTTPLFTTPLEIKFIRNGKPDTTIRFQITGNTTLIMVPDVGTVTSVKAIDPNNWIINKNGLIQKDPALIVTAVSEQETAENGLRIYPNPADEVVTIESENDQPHILTIYDPKGKKLESKSFQRSTALDLKPHPSGWYLFMTESADGLTKRHRLVKK